MKKEKKEEEKGTKELKEILKEYGKVILKGSELLEKKKDLKSLSFSPLMDIGLNGGLLEGSWTVLSGLPKKGKAQPYYSLVQTPKGPVEMGSIKIGDFVCTPKSGVAEVIGISEQGNKDVYRIHFKHDFYDCTEDHLLSLIRNDRKATKFVKTVKEIKDDLRYPDRYKWGVLASDPLYMEERSILVNPYLIGALIGDGTIGDSAHTPMITSADQDILDIIENIIKDFDCRLQHSADYSYRISSNNHGINKITDILRYYKLKGCNSHTKFIPKDYLYNSIENRWSLFQGLMDTDGSVTDYKSIEYTTVSEQLMNDVKWLAQSLGFFVTVQRRKTYCNNKSFWSYRMKFSGGDLTKSFRCKRKIKTNRTKNKIFKTIHKIEKIGNDNCRCIQLNTIDGLYLTDNCTITHNSSHALQICANAQAEGRKIIYLDGEARLKAYNLVGIEGLDLDKMDIIQSPEDKQLSAEDFLTITEMLYKQEDYKGCVIVIDSTSSLLPRAELDADVSGSIRANFPKLMAHWIKKNAQSIVNQKVIIILITHYVTNTSGYGKSKLADGGLYMQYQADTILDLVNSEPWEDEDKKQIGLQCGWKIATSSMGSSNKEVTTFLRFGKGIDKIQEYINIAVEFGLISKSGAWYTCTFMSDEEDYDEKKYKTQGMPKLYNLISENKELYEILSQKVKALLL